MNLLSFPTKLHVVPDCSDERFEEEVVYSSLEEFMNRNKPKEKKDDKLQEILEMKAKIKYYLSEIEMFTPRTR